MRVNVSGPVPPLPDGEGLALKRSGTPPEHLEHRERCCLSRLSMQHCTPCTLRQADPGGCKEIWGRSDFAAWLEHVQANPSPRLKHIQANPSPRTLSSVPSPLTLQRRQITGTARSSLIGCARAGCLPASSPHSLMFSKFLFSGRNLASESPCFSRWFSAPGALCHHLGSFRVLSESCPVHQCSPNLVTGTGRYPSRVSLRLNGSNV